MLLSALNKLPPIAADVFRGEVGSTYDHQKALERYSSIPAEGGIYQPAQFTSTTRGRTVESQSFINDYQILYFIKGKTGRNMSEISTRPYEDEVLFLPYTRFRVLKKEIITMEKTTKYPQTRKYIITLKEI